MTNRQSLRLEIDKARRAQLEQQGGYEAVERDAHGHDKFLRNRAERDPRDELIVELQAHVDDLKRRLQRAHERTSKARASRDKLLREPRRGWWHPIAQNLREKGLTYQAIGQLLDVDHSSVVYACNPERRHRKLEADKARHRRLRSVA